MIAISLFVLWKTDPETEYAKKSILFRLKCRMLFSNNYGSLAEVFVYFISEAVQRQPNQLICQYSLKGILATFIIVDIPFDLVEISPIPPVEFCQADVPDACTAVPVQRFSYVGQSCDCVLHSMHFADLR